MKHKSPGLLYLLWLLTGGQFSWIWLVLLMRDVNKLEGRKTFPVPIIAVTLAVLLPTYLYLALSFGSSREHHLLSFDALWNIGAGLTLMLVAGVVIVENRVYRLAQQKYGPARAAGTVILTIFGLSFLLVQMKINRLLKERL